MPLPGADDDFGLAPRPASGPKAVDPLIGIDLGGVRIEALLGEGGMGRVYRARQADPDREVAVKVVRFGISNEKTLRRFRREAEFLSKLEHPGIARIFVVGTYESDFGDMPFFVMEYVPGATSITRFARDHGLSVHDRLALFARVCDAVAHGHGNGVVHRDVKPGNILVDANGNPKVIDFGVAKSTDSDLTLTRQSDSGSLVGTVQYMAPEQFVEGHDASSIGSRADVYALGVVLYELVSGDLPYSLEGKAVHEASLVVCEEIPRPLRSRDKSCPQAVSLIADRCLQKAPRDRYRDAEEIAVDVRRFLAGSRLLHARTNPLAGLFRGLAGRRRWLVPMLAALVLAALPTLLWPLDGSLTRLAGLSRYSAASSGAGDGLLSGKWRWIAAGTEIAPAEFFPDGRVVGGRVTATWALVDPAKREYRITWSNGYVDLVTLSADGRTLSGQNTEGSSVEGRRK
ncbi:MAG: serine/threonine-protein kinase [Planctomycetaceae bacterium]